MFFISETGPFIWTLFLSSIKIDNLPSSISVYLKATADTLTDRLKDSIEKRPLISHLQNPVELKEFITKHLFERSFYYEKSKVKIKTDDLDVNAVVKLINQLLTLFHLL